MGHEQQDRNYDNTAWLADKGVIEALCRIMDGDLAIADAAQEYSLSSDAVEQIRRYVEGQQPASLSISIELPWSLTVDDSYEMQWHLPVSESEPVYPETVIRKLDNPGFKLCLDGVEANLRFWTMSRESQKPLLWDDRTGRISVTHVLVVFGTESLKSLGYSRDRRKVMVGNEDLTSLSLRYVNRFLHVYRHVTSSYWVRPLRPTDILGIYCHLELINGFIERWMSSDEASWLRPILLLQSDEHDNRIQEKLHEGWEETGLSELQYAAWDLADRGAFAASVIAIESFFEGVVTALLQQHFYSVGADKKTISSAILDKNGAPKPISRIISEILPTLPWFPKNDPMLEAWIEHWKTHARDPRNTLAHGHSAPTDARLAHNAFLGVIGLLFLLRKHAGDAFPAVDVSWFDVPAFLNVGAHKPPDRMK